MSTPVGPAVLEAPSPPQAPRRHRRVAPAPAPSPADVSTGKPLAYGAAVLAGLSSGLAWLVPETTAGALLGWTSAALLVGALRARRDVLPVYVAGLLGHAVGFHWIAGTVSVFGGFGPVASALIFALFVATGALQFLGLAFVHHRLGRRLDALALRAPIAVAVSELVTPRLFRWHFGHTQAAFTPLVQVADLGGAILVSFLLFWAAEAGVRALVFGERRRAFLLPALGLLLALAYGTAAMHTYGPGCGAPQEVVLVQGNASLAEKRDLGSARRNLERLMALSRRAARPGDLVVWPEGSIPAYLPARVGSATNEPLLPHLGDGSAFLVGSYASDRDANRYNAAFAVRPDGHVPEPYFKQVLIPFGESMPLASVFPALSHLNAKAGTFTAGTETKVLEIPMRRPDGRPYRLKVGPLICYEDTLPALARDAARDGAELLVNLTSDSWFGRSVALHQHHVIAAFRAIENRRYLIRATNTGLSAVVDPLGRTIVRIPPHREGTARATVGLLSVRSPYMGWVGDRPWWALLALCAAAVVANRRLERPAAAKSIPPGPA